MKPRIPCLLLLALYALCGWADKGMAITALDWDELRIDSTLPVYSEVVPLESDFTRCDYTVELLYPEYGPLTEREAAVAARHDSLIGPLVRPETYVGVSRGRGTLDISFIPLVRQGGRYMRLLSAQIVITPRERPAARRAEGKAARYAAHSKLSGGLWVKIAVDEDGMYQIPSSALRKMGFKRPENVRLYGSGGHVLPEVINGASHTDDLEEAPLHYSEKLDAYLFWGNGTVHWNGDTRVRNQYANEGFYFLTEADSAAPRAALPPATLGAGKVYTSTRGHALYEKDEFAWFSAGRNLFEAASYANNGVHTYTLRAPDMVSAPRMTVVFTASANTVTYVTPTVNGAEQAPLSLSAKGDYTYATSSSKTYDLSALGPAAQWSVRLAYPSGNEAHLDYISLSYDRKLAPSSGYVDFGGEAAGPARFDVQGAGLRVMRIGDATAPGAMVETREEGGACRVTVADASRRYVAFDDTYPFPQPRVAGRVDNQDLHALDSLDMVIIIPASGKLQDQAARLAKAHAEHDGLRVGVARADQIFNEFSSGTPDATAYRRLMKMLYDKAGYTSAAPRYLLLMGDCASDNRMCGKAWAKKNPDDYLLCYESDNSFSDTKSYVMEDYFGLLDDGEGNNLLKNKCDLGIGRFPVVSPQEAAVMVDKSIAFLTNSNAGAWKNHVYFFGDDGDENEHMDYADRVARNVIAKYPDMEVHKVMWDAYTRVSTTSNNTYPEVTSIMRFQMQDGALVMNYTGHAAAYGLSHEFVLLREDFATTQSERPALWVTVACDVMPFDGQAANIGETAVLNAKGGALAFYGTTRTVYASQNFSMNNFFMQYLFAASPDGSRNRLGDAIRLAKEKIIMDGRESGYQENKLQYALLGDPALVIGAPGRRVELDSVNGRPASAQGLALRAGERVRLSGRVADAKGGLLPGFSGTLHTRLFDNEETIVCKNNAGASRPFTFTDRSSLLYESRDSVRGGRFEVEFIVPVDINYSDKPCRFVFYAIDNSRQAEANGHDDSIPLGGVADNLAADTLGPAVEAYLNNEDFTDGATVNASPCFFARLEDESGVSCSGNGVGHDLTLCVDNDPAMTYNLNGRYTHEFGDFTRGSLSFPIPRLAQGPHSLTFRCWDVLNNTTLTAMDFVVDNGVATNILRLSASQNPAVSATEFLVAYDLPGSECEVVLEVFDFMGRRLWSSEQTVSSPTGLCRVPWDLTTGQGGRVGTGVYFYRCRMRCGESKWTSGTQKIIVMNNK